MWRSEKYNTCLSSPVWQVRKAKEALEVSTNSVWGCRFPEEVTGTRLESAKCPNERGHICLEWPQGSSRQAPPSESSLITCDGI